MNRQHVTKFGLLALAATLSLSAAAQRTSDLRINEILVLNETNYEDDFGERSSWIEIFNTSYGSVNVGGCYLTDDRSNLKKYPIPRGDNATIIPPRQSKVFWADNKPTHGTFHLNFLISDTHFLALVNSDGRTIIDSVRYPAQRTDVSYARIPDGKGAWQFAASTTPATLNVLPNNDAKSEKFLKNDPTGVAMTLTAMLVVFTALLLLFIVFKNVGKAAIRLMRPKVAKASAHSSAGAQPEAKPAKVEPADGATFAAIALALRLYEMEMTESTHNILTINRIAKMYSPWSSKIYGLRETPTLKK